MKFIIEYTNEIHIGNPIYVINEKSLYYEPWLECDCSIMIGTGYNSLDVDLNTNKVVHISGLNPKSNWKSGVIHPPKAKLGVLKIESSENLISGIGITYAENWVTTYDRRSGWLQIGNYNIINKFEFVNFANNTIAVIDNNDLKSILVKPKIIKSL